MKDEIFLVVSEKKRKKFIVVCCDLKEMQNLF